MSQMYQLGTTATSVFTDDDGLTKVVYHATVVVKFNSNKIVLNTGGWSTATTKARMNQASNQFRLGYSVVQKAGRWFVEYAGQSVEFDETATLDRISKNINSDKE